MLRYPFLAGSLMLALSCESEWVPPDRCLQRFDSGSCLAHMPVFAFDGTSCVGRIYGGCGGNDNRFFTLEECLLTCEGKPSAEDCPEGRIPHEVCLSCGQVGGCGQSEVVCAQPCSTAEECEPSVGSCFDGVCQVGHFH